MSPTKVGNLSWKCNGIDPHFSGMLQIQISPKQSFPTTAIRLEKELYSSEFGKVCTNLNFTPA